jgi:hypothetical protein
MFKQSWGKTTVKFIALLFTFSVCLVLGIVGNMMFIILNL